MQLKIYNYKHTAYNVRLTQKDLMYCSELALTLQIICVILYIWQQVHLRERQTVGACFLPSHLNHSCILSHAAVIQLQLITTINIL